ncbi:MAG: glycosyltransferase family 4 protein [Gammaproteobacteria bacterium]|nr:glycosyltransferase family 4 protein [Gammaproteobacteria bacterium]MDH3465230.1 glycosyltransferase family 4 protein [Gammaproteobacteria bacterium]
MKRVLFISPQPFFQWRGSPIRVNFDLLALSESGYETDLLTLPIGDEKTISGIQIYRVPNLFKVSNIPIGPSFHKVIFDALLLFKGFRLCRKNRYSVIHGVEEAGVIAVILAKLFRARSIFEKHSDPMSYRGGMFINIILALYKRVEAITVRHADLVIGTGPGLAAQAKTLGAVGPVHDIFDVPSSLVEPDPKIVADISARLRTSPDDQLIMFVGSFAVYQGVDLIFEMIPNVVAQCSSARFVIIGGTPEEIESKSQQLRQANAADAVVFLNKIPPDELPNYLAASDVLMAPRLSGVNTPLKILDYFKAGRAIVATDTPPNRLILDDTTAVFTDPNPVSFAEQVIKLLKDSEHRDRLGKKGHELYRTKFNFTKFKQLMVKAYTDLDELQGR